jgi:hypothetical protein
MYCRREEKWIDSGWIGMYGHRYNQKCWSLLAGRYVLERVGASVS